MFNFGGMEILVILVVALLVLGPDKLPRFMRTIGKAVGEVRRASTEFQRSINVDLAENSNPTIDRKNEPLNNNAIAGEPSPAIHSKSTGETQSARTPLTVTPTAPPVTPSVENTTPERRKLARPRATPHKTSPRMIRKTGLRVPKNYNGADKA